MIKINEKASIYFAKAKIGIAVGILKNEKISIYNLIIMYKRVKILLDKGQPFKKQKQIKV